MTLVSSGHALALFLGSGGLEVCFGGGAGSPCEAATQIAQLWFGLSSGLTGQWQSYGDSSAESAIFNERVNLID